jgi:hypothetical protein
MICILYFINIWYNSQRYLLEIVTISNMICIYEYASIIMYIQITDIYI